MPKPKVQLRKPPTVPAVADSFVAAAVERPSVQTSGRPAVQVSSEKPAGGGDVPTPFRKGLVARRDGKTLRRMTLYLPPDLAKRLELAAVDTGLDMSDIVADAVKAWLIGKG